MQFLFSDHLLDTDTRELRRGGTPIAVQPQVFDLLIYLLENRERVVGKDDLFAAVWDGRTVADSTLSVRINAARKAVGDNGEEQRLIRTIARKGIRFVGDVQCRPRDHEPVEAGGSLGYSPRPALPPSDRPTIAVLPFANMSDQAEQEYFADGISEDVIAALTKLRWFFVIARNSSFSYKGKSVHLKQIADELGVGYVVEGSVRKYGDRLRIAVQLNDVATGSQLWAERYDRKLSNVFAVQDEITDAIAAAIEPQILVAENFRSKRKPPVSLDAWDLVIRALWHFWRFSRQDNADAQALLEKAIALDPNYGQALSVLATCQMFGIQMGWVAFKKVAPVADRAARAAIRIDSEDAWAHTALGSCYFSTRLDDALAECELALRLNPNFSMAQGVYGLALCYTGRRREAIEVAQRALRLSPRDPFSAWHYGVAATAQFFGGNYPEAIALAREAIRQRGDFSGPYRVLTAAAGMAGHADIAASALQDLRRAQPGISLAWVANSLPWKVASEREHFVEGCRRAGLD